ARDVVDLLMDRLEEMLRLEEIADAIKRLVVYPDRAQEGLLRLDIVRGGAVAGPRGVRWLAQPRFDGHELPGFLFFDWIEALHRLKGCGITHGDREGGRLARAMNCWGNSLGEFPRLSPGETYFLMAGSRGSCMEPVYKKRFADSQNNSPVWTGKFISGRYARSVTTFCLRPLASAST